MKDFALGALLVLLAIALALCGIGEETSPEEEPTFQEEKDQ